jgi:predicted nucleotidyltransferase
VISKRGRATIAELARRYGVSRVWVFGSNADQGKRGRDVDLAVEGLAPARFFQFVGELMLSLPKPVDVVAMDKRSKLTTLIRRDGIPVYGEPGRES